MGQHHNDTLDSPTGNLQCVVFGAPLKPWQV